MALSSFCGVVTLQVGTAMLAVLYYLISALVMGINAFDYTNHPRNTWPVPLVLLTFFALFMVVTGIIMFFSAYSESRAMCIVAVVCVVIVWVYWMILSGLSFSNNSTTVRRVCHGSRCPETFWMANLRYRKVIIETRSPVYKYVSSTNALGELPELTKKEKNKNEVSPISNRMFKITKQNNNVSLQMKLGKMLLPENFSLTKSNNGPLYIENLFDHLSAKVMKSNVRHSFENLQYKPKQGFEPTPPKSPDKESDQDPNKESNQDPDKESDKDPDKESDKDPNEESDKDTDKESDKDPDKESDKDPNEESDKDPNEESDQDPNKEYGKDTSKESDQDYDNYHDLTTSQDHDSEHVTEKPGNGSSNGVEEGRDLDKPQEEKYSFELGFTLLGAIIFFVVNILFFGFTIVVVWGYAQEIKWMELYIDI